MTIGVGDTIVLYSDGVTEAMNKDELFFSEERLIQSLRDVMGRSHDDTLKNILIDVRENAAGTPRSDDITILTLQYKGQLCLKKSLSKSQLTLFPSL